MFYKETRNVTLDTKTQYRDDLLTILENLKLDARRTREGRWREIFDSPESFRARLKAMLGYPLTAERPSTLPEVTAVELSRCDGVTLSRLTFTVMDGLRMTGLIFRRDGDARRPLVIAQHGGEGTPELISGLYDSTGNYNDMVERTLKHDVHVFAPQLLLWNDNYGVSTERGEIDAQLKSLGSSVTAFEVYGIRRILDYFEAQPYVSTFGMIGLSYGGFYTLFTAAVDTRIKAALSCSYYCDRDVIKSFHDWRWQDSALMMQDAEIAALVYPRKLVVAMGASDPLFPIESTRGEFERLMRLSAEVGRDWVEFTEFDGTHEFIRDDGYIEKVVREL